MTRSDYGWLAGIAGMMALFAALSYSAVLTKSATADEPLHLAGGYLQKHLSDYRIDPEDPALFNHLAALPLKRQLKVDTSMGAWKASLDHYLPQWLVTQQVLYRSPGVDSIAMLNRSRAVMLTAALLLPMVIAWWGWKLAGPVAATAGVALVALDPNFLGHAPLVKNDVLVTLMMLAACAVAWRIGDRAGVGWIALLAVICGLAVNVKFSGLLLGPIIAGLLLYRSFRKVPWQVGPWELRTVANRVLAAVGICIACAIVACAMIWASYGLRFAPTPAGELFDHRPLVALVAENTYKRQQGAEAKPPVWFSERFEPPAPVRLALWAQDHRLLPQAWLYGFVYTYGTSLLRDNYLLGERSLFGWPHYFPVAMAVKTPLATLVATALAGALMLMLRLPGSRVPRSPKLLDRWALICLTAPPAFYALLAITGSLNLGLRHILPVYPFIFLGVGIAIATLWRIAPQRTAMVAGAMGLILAVETFTAWPNYIAFFNVAAGGTEGGTRFLSDSNLDWGQDLPELARFRRANPDGKLYFMYFGIDDPAAYGIDFEPLPGTLTDRPHAQVSEPGYIAISVTYLQGTYQPPERVQRLQIVAGALEPVAAPGGTIYVFRILPEQVDFVRDTLAP
jgi:hypothetical protein